MGLSRYHVLGGRRAPADDMMVVREATAYTFVLRSAEIAEVHRLIIPPTPHPLIPPLFLSLEPFANTSLPHMTRIGASTWQNQ